MRRALLAASVLLGTIVLAGCAAGGLSSGSAMFGLVMSLTMFIAACSSIKPKGGVDASLQDSAVSQLDGAAQSTDATVRSDATTASDASLDATTEASRDASAWTDARIADANVTDGSSLPDASAMDAGGPAGRWEACCHDFTIDSCFCPEGLACNYGWFVRCDDGSCAPPTLGCPPGGGTWNRCCVDGEMTYCECPSGAACNYRYVDCGDDTCAFSEDLCGSSSAMMPSEPSPS